MKEEIIYEKGEVLISLIPETDFEKDLIEMFEDRKKLGLSVFKINLRNLLSGHTHKIKSETKKAETQDNLNWQTRDEFPVTTNALQKLYEIFVFTSRNHKEDKMIACLYGIICGWDDASYEELKLKHNWSDDDIKWQKLWHKNYKKGWNAFMEKHSDNQ